MFTFDADKLRMETDTSQRARYVRYDGVSLDTMTAAEMRAALMEIFDLLYGHLAYAPPAETGEDTPSYKEYMRRRELVGEAIRRFGTIGDIEEGEDV